MAPGCLPLPAPPPPPHLAAVPGSSGMAQLPVELLGTVLQLVLQDDKEQQRRQAGPALLCARARVQCLSWHICVRTRTRTHACMHARMHTCTPPSQLKVPCRPLPPARPCRHVAQFVSRSWLEAYRCTAYSQVSLDVGAAMHRFRQQGGLSEAEAAAALLEGLAARLPYAAEVTLTGLPLLGAAPEGGRAAAHGASWHLRWQLGELLVAALQSSTHLSRLSVDFLPQLPQLLQHRLQQRQRRLGVLPLESLGISALPAVQLLRHLALLRTQPLHTLALSDAACLGEADSAVLAAALAALPQLAYLSLGGSGVTSSLSSAKSRSSAGSDAARLCQTLGGQPTSGSAAPPAAAAAATPAAPAAPTASAGINLPSLPLVAAAVALPSLQHLELSLTFGRQSSHEQQQYLHRLGCVLHAQRRLREAQGRAGGGVTGEKSAECSYSRVSVTVHEHLHGDLSAGGRLRHAQSAACPASSWHATVSLAGCFR